MLERARAEQRPYARVQHYTGGRWVMETMAAADGQYLVKVEEYGIQVYIKSYETPPS